jgi:polysaccharide export outer membrane protein
VQAAGLSPDQLRQKVADEAKRYVEDPQPTIVVKQINSRKVFITGNVTKPGPYQIMAPTTVLQLISMSGGLTEYAHSKKITIMRTENGRQVAYHFNYKDVAAGKNMKQNIELKPGDTVVVP